MLKIVKKPAAEAKAEVPAEVKGEPKAGTTAKSSVTEFSAIPLMSVVSIEVGYSHKLPNEDWVKVGIRLDVPAKNEDIDKVYAYAKEWTDGKLSAAVEEITSGE